MDENNKEKFALWLRPETKRMVEKNYKDNGCRSRSDFIEKAIVFYCGYLTATDYREYFPNVIVSTMKGLLDTFENRMANLLFKNAVELSMLLHVVSATHDIDGDTLEDLKVYCRNEVKRLNGSVSLADAWKFQRRIDDKLEKE